MGRVYSRKYYEDNKSKLSLRRRERYKANPEIRARAIQRAASNREKTKQVRPVGYDIQFDDAANQIGITKWALSEWRKKSYFPEPLKISGRLWFTAAQVNLIIRVKEFFDKNGIRVGSSKRIKLMEVVDLVYSNWK